MGVGSLLPCEVSGVKSRLSGLAVVLFPAEPSHQPLYVTQHRRVYFFFLLCPCYVISAVQLPSRGCVTWVMLATILAFTERFANVSLSKEPFPFSFPAWSGRLSVFCPRRASEWQLDQPSWSGRLRITAKGKVAYIKLEDRTSGKVTAPQLG